MKVLVLGGAGRIGAPAAKQLLARGAKVAIAGRDLGVTERTAATLGCGAVAIDARDEARLAAIARDFDLIVNTAGPDFETTLPAARAAVAAKTHYIDLNAHGACIAELLELDERVRAADRILLTGIGHVPGISNLLMLHAARQLDRVDHLESGSIWAVTPELLQAIGNVAVMRASKRINASWQQIITWATGPVRVVRDGQRVDVDPARETTTIALPDGFTSEVFPIGCTEPLTVPRRIAGIRSLATYFGILPRELHAPLHRATASFAGNPHDTTLGFLESLAVDVARLPSTQHRHRAWARARGVRDGKPVTFTCSPIGGWTTTVGPLVTACMHLLDGKIGQRGVLAPEDCFEPIAFLREAAALSAQPPADSAPLLEESWAESIA